MYLVVKLKFVPLKLVKCFHGLNIRSTESFLLGERVLNSRTV